MLRLKLDHLSAFPALSVGLSGGVDSHVLLHQLHTWAQQRKAPPISAIHVHHGLQPAADQFATHCESICQALKIPLQVVHLHITQKPGESLEALAREARYQALFATMPTGAALLLGHHATDQAENFLLRALRGSGLRGLSGMQAVSVRQGHTLLRPLLHHSREAIVAYAKAHHLTWIEDPSNENNIFMRNFLRNEIFSRFHAHFPQAVMTLSRTAAHLQEVHTFIEKQVETHLTAVSVGEYLNILTWKTLDPFLQKLVLQKWIETKTQLLSTTLCLETVINEVIGARQDRHPQYHWRGWWFTRRREWLMLKKRAR